MSDQKWVLVEFRKDWADEFDVHGFYIRETTVDAEYQRIKDILEACDDGSVVFGTNEWWEVEEFALNDFTITEIDQLTAGVLMKSFGSYFGFIPYFNDYGLYEEKDCL